MGVWGNIIINYYNYVYSIKLLLKLFKINILLNYNYSLKSIKYYSSNNTNKKLEYLMIIFFSKVDGLYFFAFKN